MAQKSILSFFGGGGAKNKANNNELKKPEKSLSSKKKGDIATVEKDGEWGRGEGRNDQQFC